MGENRPIKRLALSNLPSNVQLKKSREDPKIQKDSTETSENILIKNQKISLVNKWIERNFRDVNKVSLEDQIYEEGYQKDYIRFLLRDEKKYVLDTNFLQSTIFSDHSRRYIINILQKMQKYYEFPDNEYYMAVKLMDSTLIVCADPRDAILHGVTCFWMIHKLLGTYEFVSTKNLLTFLGKILTIEYNFTVNHILKMEKTILVISNCTIQIPEPSIYIEHFFRKLRILQNKLAYYGTYFVCDCMSMFPKFSYMPTSLLAIVALYTTLVVLNQDTSLLIRMVENVFQESLIKEIHDVAVLEICFIKKSDFQGPFVKFLAPEKLGVSILFENFIKMYQPNE